jgi:hypothetical protein
MILQYLNNLQQNKNTRKLNRQRKDAQTNDTWHL